MRKTAIPEIMALGLLALWSWTGVPLYARGQIEERVARARQLIAENNLNEAELLLVEIEREDPNRQDEAEEMRSLIRRARMGFNAQYAELIRLLKTPGREDEAVEIIRRLEALDSNPNPATARLIFEAKRTVLFKQSERRFNELMDRALVLLDNRQFTEAVQLYLSGFEIHREIFEEEAYGELLKASILRSLNTVETNAQIFQDPEQGFTEIPARGAGLVAISGTLNAEWAPVLAAMSGVAELYWESTVALADLREQDAMLTQAAALSRGDPYLTFMNALISGRDLNGKTEGLLGSLYRFWMTQLTDWPQTLAASMDREFRAGISALSMENFTVAEAAFRRTENLAAIGRRLNALWNHWLFSDQGLRPDLRSEWQTAASMQERFYIGALFASQGAQFTALRMELAPSVALPPETADALNRLAAQSQTSRIAAELALADLRGLPARRASLEATGITFDAQAPPEILAAWQSQAAFFRNAEIDFYNRRATLSFPPLETATARVESERVRAQALLDGSTRRDASGLEYLARFPREAADLISQTNVLAQRTRGEVSTFLEDFRTISAQVGEAPAIQNWLNRGTSLLNRLDQYTTYASQVLPLAQARANEAASLLTRARESYAAAQSALTQERFPIARTSLSNARSLWEASFLLQDDPATRSDLESRGDALALAILNGEREQVARDVRTFIQQGQQAYRQSQFANAEEILLRARDRWADTESDPNVEVEFWLGQTRNALTFSTGRFLARTDPLYFEIQPLLNFAVQDFERARELFAQEKKIEGQSLLARASARLEQVRIPFPLNRTAGVLQLRILQLSATKEEFDAEFARQFQSAIDLSATANGGAPALAALQDLAEIQPNYPGLASQIRRLRVVVGLDPPPPNPADLARSRQQASEARVIANSNNPTQFARGRALCEEALRLDPNNAEAQRLLDFFLIHGPRTGAASALTEAERRSLDQASTLTNQGRFSEARVLVERLLSVPKNRTNQEILRLQTSINARLRL